MCCRIGRQFAGSNVEGLDLELRTEHAGEHRRVIAELLFEIAGRPPGFEDRELHRRALPRQGPSANAERMETKALEGRHALVTGGGTGIGAAAATHLHAAGAKVSLLGRRMEPLLAVAEGVSGARDRLRCDRSRSDPARVRRGARAERPDRDADRQCRDRRERAIPQDDARKLGPDHRGEPDRRVRMCADGACRPHGERKWPPRVRRFGREPARRPLCCALRRVEARAARPHALARGRICEDEPDGERRLPRLCRHADDRPVGRARVARSRAAAKISRATSSPT